MHWHAVYSTPSGEGRAKLGIEAAGVETFYPVERIRAHHRGEFPVVRLRSLFPRYLFARFDAGRDLGRVQEVDGVHEVLRIGNTLLRIPDAIVEGMRSAQDGGVFDRTGLCRYATGDVGTLKAGPLAGLIAKIRSAPSANRLKIVLEFMGSTINAEIGVDKFQKLTA